MEMQVSARGCVLAKMGKVKGSDKENRRQETGDRKAELKERSTFEASVSRVSGVATRFSHQSEP